MIGPAALMEAAVKARTQAYAPYSEFTVGAALLTEEDHVYTGCNMENSAYSPSLCAERCAFAKAVSEGERHFKAIAIVGGKRESEPDSPCYPCGVCRQVMQDFCDPEHFTIYVMDHGHVTGYLLGELLPAGFKL